MADFLIMNKNHWTKDLSEEDKAEWTLKQTMIFDAVNELGDIIEAFPDKKLGPYAHADGKFKIIRVPGLELKDAKPFYEQPQVRVFTEEIILKKRRFKLILPVTYDADLDITLSESEFLKYLVDKDVI